MAALTPPSPPGASGRVPCEVGLVVGPPPSSFVIPDEARSAEIGDLVVAADYEGACTLTLPVALQPNGLANAHPARFRLSRAAWPARPE